MSIVLINSHDGRCSYKLYSGIFRLVCSNGAIVGWTKYIVRLTHRWHSSWEVQMLTRTIADSSSEIADRIDVLKKRMLLPDEKTQFAKDTLKMLYKRTGDKTRLQHVDEILIPKRDEDIGDSVWTVMNVIQENGMRGYVYNDKRLGQRKGRVMTSIAREVQFNTDITQLAWERFGT